MSALRDAENGERRVDEVLRDEPGLELVGPQHPRDQQVVGAIVAKLVGAVRGRANLRDDELVGLE
jgi:hypothetical protein